MLPVTAVVVLFMRVAVIVIEIVVVTARLLLLCHDNPLARTHARNGRLPQ